MYIYIYTFNYIHIVILYIYMYIYYDDVLGICSVGAGLNGCDRSSVECRRLVLLCKVATARVTLYRA